MTNAVLTYTGNVCSTPMIAYAGLTGDVFVPVREQFDLYQIERVLDDPARQASELARTLAALYERRAAGLFEYPVFKRYHHWTHPPSIAETPHLMFKWRPFAMDVPDVGMIRDVFLRHEVGSLTIVRRSVVEQALKVFMSNKVYGDAHRQFKAARMSLDEYEAYIAHQGGLRVEVTAEDMLTVRKQASAYFRRSRLLVSATRFFFPSEGAPRFIIAEDIFRPKLDRERFNAVITSVLGDVKPLGEQAEPDVRKAGLDLSHCANLDSVLADDELKATEAGYLKLLDSLTPLRPF